MYAICPGFYRFLDVGQPSKLIQLQREITKEVCFKIIDAVMQVSLLVVIAVDDLQSNQHHTESNILLQLLE